jgi:hypothetical protein
MPSGRGSRCDERRHEWTDPDFAVTYWFNEDGHHCQQGADALSANELIDSLEEYAAHLVAALEAERDRLKEVARDVVLDHDHLAHKYGRLPSIKRLDELIHKGDT